MNLINPGELMRALILEANRGEKVKDDFLVVATSHYVAYKKPGENQGDIQKKISASARKECSLCHDIVIEKQDPRFAILSSCNDCFCVECIQDHRQQVIPNPEGSHEYNISCPVCHISSSIVIPCPYWVSRTEDKQEMKIQLLDFIFSEQIELRDLSKRLAIELEYIGRHCLTLRLPMNFLDERYDNKNVFVRIVINIPDPLEAGTGGYYNLSSSTILHE